MMIKHGTILGACALLLSASVATGAPKKPAAKPAKKANAKLVPLRIALPKPAYLGTPKNIKLTANIERPTGKPRPAFLAPPGTKNVALKKAVTSSDEAPIIGSLDLVTDGDKEARDGGWVELGPGTQWVQVDLGKVHNIYALVMWHYHGEARIYRDVVVRVADDPDFIENVRTVFNNDIDNSSGQGLGKDKEFFESNEGKLVNAKGIKARYVRFYSNGNTADDQNHYTEIEVYGK